MKTWTGENKWTTMRSVHENKTVLTHSLKNLSCPCNHELKFAQIFPRFYDVIWKFKLPLLSWVEIFAKIRQFWWYHMTFELPLLSQAETLAKKKKIFVDITWKFELPLLSRVDNFTKTRQLSSSDFKNWIDYYHESNFFKNMTVLMVSIEIWTSPYYHELKLSQK